MAGGTDRAARSTRDAARHAPAHPIDPPSSGIDGATAYLPRILVEMLSAHPDRTTPWWEWVEGTLVMADVSGFTALSERLAKAGKEGAEWLTDLINRFFGRMLDIAWDCGGTTLTFGGDAILLLFYGEDHERRAIAAALRMLNGTQKLPAYRVGSHHVKLSMSMGAHAGEFLTASAGTDRSAQFLIIGPETVMTAGAEAVAASGELAITPELARRVGRCVETELHDDYLRVVRLVDTPRYEHRPDEALRVAAPEALEPFLPPFVASALGTEPDSPIPSPGSEHRSVAVVFVNVLGVDDLLASEGPDALVREIQRYLEPVVRLVDANHGYLVSNDIYTNGFKLIVAFGAPVAHERDAENALRFAASLRDEIDALGLRLSHRIGVNGGFVFAGDVGPSYRRQYTVMGDAVNLAARLMSAADPGQVIVSAATAETAGDCFLTQQLPPVRVKGKERPIDIRAVEGQCEPAPPSETPASGFFGRERELATLERARDDVERGAERVVVIRGEPGMGKSRLAAEFERPLPERGWRVIAGRAHEHTRGQPFTPWIPILDACIGLDGDDDAEARSARVLEALERTGRNLVEWASLLNPLLRVTIPATDSARALSAADGRKQIFFLITELLRQTSAASPLLLHFEDLHWADGSSIELLEHVARDVTERPILMLATERIEHAPQVDLPEAVTLTIDLSELAGDAALEVVRQTLGIDLPAAAAEVLMQKTRGNPLFLQEVARSISRSGAAADATDELDLARRMAEVDVPTQVQGLLMSSIDSLPLSDKDVLRTASVIGSTFDAETLRDVSGCAEDELHASLSRLLDQALVCERVAERTTAYEFRHALVQEVAYHSLPFATRRRVHHRVAEHLEETNQPALDAVYESLTHHYQLSGDRPRTAVFAVKAGGKAQTLLAHEEATEYYRIAKASLPARTSAAACARSYLLEQIGDCYDQVGKHSQAAIEYRDSLARTSRCSSGDASGGAALLGLHDPISLRGRESLLCYKTAVSYTRTHRDYKRSLVWLERAARTLPRGEALQGARIEQTRGIDLLWIGEHEEADRCARHSLAVARRYGDGRLQARAATTIAGAFMDTGNIRMSIRYDALALEAYEKSYDVPGQAEAHANLAADFTCHGDFASALDHSQKALAIYQRTGDMTAAAIAHCNVAEIFVIRGDYDGAIEQVQTALQLCERVGGGCTTVAGFARLNLARALERQGHLDEADEQLRQSISLLKTAGATTFLTEAAVQQADVLFARGDLPRARTLCAQALEESQASQMRLVETRALRLLGLIAHAEGNTVEAERCLSESADIARMADAPYEQALAYLGFAEIRAATGRSYKRPLSRARALLEATGASPDIERAIRLVLESA